MNVMRKEKLKIMGFIFLGALAGGLGSYFIFLKNFPQPLSRANAKNFYSDERDEKVVKIVRRIKPAVVDITTLIAVRHNEEARFRRRILKEMGVFEWFQFPEEYKPSLGTGFIVDVEKQGSKAIVLTNEHVIATKNQIVDQIHIRFSDKKDSWPGEVVALGGYGHDLALVKAELPIEGIQIPELGDSQPIETGRTVLAFGNALGLGTTVSDGIVSAEWRSIPGFPLSGYLQFTASINPGNSGGPIINLREKVVAIANMMHGEAQNIGFGIPVKFAELLLKRFREGKLDEQKRIMLGYIGVRVENLDPKVKKGLNLPPQLSGVVVNEVFPGEPAAQAKLLPLDIITEFNNKKILSVEDFTFFVISSDLGKEVPIKIFRKGKFQEISIKISQKLNTFQRRFHYKDRKSNRPQLPSISGMQLKNLSPERARDLGLSYNQGILVSSVLQNSLAQKAGISRGDIILEVIIKNVTGSGPIPILNTTQFYALVKNEKNCVLIIRKARSPDTISVNLEIHQS